MAKYYFLTCLIIILSKYEHQVCSKRAFSKLDDAIGYTSSAIGIKSFVESFLDNDLEKATFEHVMDEIRTMNLQLTSTFRLIMESISELPNILIYLDEEKDILRQFSRLGEGFRLSMQKKKEIVDGLVENPDLFEIFKQNYNRMMDNSMIALRRIFLNAHTTSFLTKNYGDANKKYYNVCKTNMTQLQALDHVLGLVETVFDQYYDVKVFMLETISTKKTNMENAKKILRENAASDFESIALEFKKIMSSASREFFKCDPTRYAGYKDLLHDIPRYENKPGSPYYELQQITTYIAENEQKSSCKSKIKPEKCRDDVPSKVCKNSRPCKEFLDCTHMHPHARDQRVIEQGYNLCLNHDKNAYDRYLSIEDPNEDSLDCSNGDPVSAHRYRDGSNLDFCDCSCHENIYFFDDSYVLSDYAHNKIVTGARLAVEDNTIHIQIQEAEVLPNGMIRKGDDSLVWKKPQKMNRLKGNDKKHLLESVDLTEIDNLPTNAVITGFRFKEIPGTTRVQLVILASSYNFRTGEVSKDEPILHEPDFASDEYQFTDEAVPLSARSETKPLSKNNQYISFTITSRKLDGSQTTIPFIDTQYVETKIPMPLSGAGLYLRGVPGFGGFLALKLYTYDITPYVDLSLAEETF